MNEFIPDAEIVRRPINPLVYVVIAGASLLLVVGIVTALVLPKPQQAPEKAGRFGEQLEATTQAERLVKQMLDERVRHTARFPVLKQSFSEGMRETTGNRALQVSGEVFVTNAFGAEVRHEYSVAFEVIDGRLDPLLVKLNGRPVWVKGR